MVTAGIEGMAGIEALRIVQGGRDPVSSALLSASPFIILAAEAYRYWKSIICDAFY